MKKRAFVFILLATLVLSFAACGGNESSNNKPFVGDSSTADAGQNDSTAKEEIPEQKGEENPEQEKEKITFSEISAVDNDECSIKITGIDPDGTWGYTLKTQLENKSSDKTYMFSVTNGAVNGVEIDPFFATEVAAEKKANDTISFSGDVMEKIGEPTDIELFFRVYDSNDWTAENVAEESVHVYPYGEDRATIFEREPEDSDFVIAENEYIKVTALGYEYDPVWGYTINLFLENRSDAEIMFSVDDASINGYMMDPFWATSVFPGKCAFDSMSWSNNLLEENDVTDVSEVEFLFKAYDSNDWAADKFFEDVVTLVAQ